MPSGVVVQGLVVRGGAKPVFGDILGVVVEPVRAPTSPPSPTQSMADAGPVKSRGWAVDVRGPTSIAPHFYVALWGPEDSEDGIEGRFTCSTVRIITRDKNKQNNKFWFLEISCTRLGIIDVLQASF